MKTTTENVLAYITKRHRSILGLTKKFRDGKKLRGVLGELRLADKIRYGRLPLKTKGMYLHAYVPERPPEGIKVAGTKAGRTPGEQVEREIRGRQLIAMMKEELN